MIGENCTSQVNEKVGAMYRAIGNSEDGQVFLEFCLHTLLYQPPSPGYDILLCENFVYLIGTWGD